MIKGSRILQSVGGASARNAGVVGLEQYFPKTFVSQSALEKFDGVGAGKYVIGLEQDAMAFCTDQEDINSFMLTAVSSLLIKYNVDPAQVGRLEVGTETLLDKSKSIKTTLMDLFGDNTDIEGVDNINACYGGTAALFNSLAWMQSPSWDGRLAIVVCGDIAVYEKGAARPTGGAGATAILLGPDAPILLEPERGSHFENAYDFYKPHMNSEYPAVDGHLSMSCYFRALDTASKNYGTRFAGSHGAPFALDTDAQFYLFHSPFTKLVRKSFARLYQNAWAAGEPLGDLDCSSFDKQWKSLSAEETYVHREMHKAFSNATKQVYQNKVMPSLKLAKQLGNTYTGSLYASLASLVSEATDDQLAQQRAVLFSYGSGLASTMFSARFVGSVHSMRRALDLDARLQERRSVPAEEYTETLMVREKAYGQADYTPVLRNKEDLFPGTWYLKNVDEQKRRTYAQQ